MKNTIALIRKHLKRAEEYDPYGPHGTARYGLGAAAMEKQGVIDMLKDLLVIAEKEEKEIASERLK